MLASMYDSIERYKFSFKWEKEIPNKTKFSVHYFEDLNADELRKILNDPTALHSEIVTSTEYCNYSCRDVTSSYLQVTFSLTNEEKQQNLDHVLKYRKAAINFLKRCIERDDKNRQDLLDYLKRTGLKIEGLRL